MLGPLLFLLYIDDIRFVSTKINFILFAYDTKITMSHVDLNALVEIKCNHFCYNISEKGFGMGGRGEAKTLLHFAPKFNLIGTFDVVTSPL